MAIKSTVFKVQLTVSDMNRNVYGDHALVLARHASETDVRLIVRILVFALNAHEYLQFAKGLADADEPDLWQIDLTGQIDHWIELGQPTEKRLRQSCSKARKVSIYTYNKAGAAHWFETVKDTALRFKHLTVQHLILPPTSEVEKFVDRSMALSCTIQDDQVLLSNEVDTLIVTVQAAATA